MAKHADYRGALDLDFNIYCPEQVGTNGDYYWDSNHWRIAVRSYKDGHATDLEELSTDLPEDFARAIGLVDFANSSEETFDDWLDQSLDGWMSADLFLEEYGDKITPRLARILARIPEYEEEPIGSSK